MVFRELDINTIDRHFPKPSYREGQKEAIEFAVNAFNSGKKFVILECPTGSGKSPIGMTIADMVPTSYYLTITKILQDQLVRDFQNSIVELKGRNAYPCTFYQREGQKMVERKLISQQQLNETMMKYNDCSTGFCKSRWHSEKTHYCTRCFPKDGPFGNGKSKGDLFDLPAGMNYSACPYYEQVYSAISSRKVVMNFSSFLFQTTMTRRFKDPRNLLIIDEAHNVEPQLLDFVSFSISDSDLQKHGIFVPELNSPYAYYIWFKEAEVVKLIAGAIEEAKNNDDPKLVDRLSRLVTKYRLFIDRVENSDKPDTEWVSEFSQKKTKAGTHRTVTLKPIFIKDFVNELLFQYADKVLFMSATILDANVFCRSLGLKKEDVAAKRIRNRFPKENRPIHLDTVAKMTGGKQAMHKWAPDLVRGVNKIVKSHKGEKGIIHTHNFAIMECLLQDCDPDVKERFLNQRDFNNKTKMLKQHARSEDSVIIAPAMHEGVDLVDSLSRFQIICKVPFANFFDNQQLARRVEIDRRYYLWLTALKLVQSYGRSVRSDTDYAATYILDESIYRFIDDCKTMLPGWFLEAIV